MTKQDNSIRVCSYNIHKGMCAMNRRDILAGLRQAIRNVDADLMFLQEVVGERTPRAERGNRRNGFGFQAASNIFPQFEFLADEVWPHHAYGKNAVYQRGHHGNAILSKYPFQDWGNHDVSRWRFSQRGVLFGELTSGLYVVCVHFGLFKRERKDQWRQLERILSENVPSHAPLIIAGDFNDWSAHLHRLINRFSLLEANAEIHGKLAKTYPANMPVLAMDRVYFRNLQLRQAGVLTGSSWRKLSDHRPVYAHFAV